MSLAPGARIGPYEVAAVVGVGGMGEVYRARDTRLNRDVAIKILPESLSADPERIARFQREAQVLAALNYPNLAQASSNPTLRRVQGKPIRQARGRRLREQQTPRQH